MTHAIAEAQRALKTHFGYDCFRAGQGELIEGILTGRDCIGIMPTGAGKSICYQVPAMMLPGLTIVISPLVSLMNDQVGALVEAGIPAAYLNSQLSAAAQSDVLNAADAGLFRLLYVAPERLDDPRFHTFACNATVSLVAVDEAHCVSQWGQDFRPSYLGIAAFIDDLAAANGRPTVAAFTATATPRVADDIQRLLALHDPLRLTTGFDRPNLHFAVEQLSDKRKVQRVATFIAANPNDSGIVYCSTRKQVDSLTEQLVRLGVAATRYHAGLSAGERTANQAAFVNDDRPVMVATNAFGMGIDKSNVRFVVHFNMPGSLEAYYQEAGRAGRDGEPAECLLLWNEGDIATCRFFIESEIENQAMTPEEIEIVRMSQRRRLAAMTGYCMTCDCLRATILRYFGEEVSGREQTGGFTNGHYARELTGNSNTAIQDETRALAAPRDDSAAPLGALGGQAASQEALGSSQSTPGGCGNCSNCEGSFDAIDVTKTARSIMRCVHEIRGRFGKGIVADMLTGSKSAKIREYGLDTRRTYNIVDESAGTIKEIIELLVTGEYLEISEGRYPLVGLGPRAREAATDEFRLYMKGKPKPISARKGKAGADASGSTNKGTIHNRAQAQALMTDEQKELFERLRQLRKRLADEEGVPPYIVFSDAALRSMCALRPADEASFLEVGGVGQVKLERYGRQFLEEINR